MRAALGESWIPAPVSSSRSACSSTTTRKPLRAKGKRGGQSADAGPGNDDCARGRQERRSGG